MHVCMYVCMYVYNVLDIRRAEILQLTIEDFLRNNSILAYAQLSTVISL
jgi:hypothetical protein